MSLFLSGKIDVLVCTSIIESGIDLNRAGTPLIEIVSEPELSNAEEAVSYLKKIHTLVKYLEISDGNMEQGSFRCDANISIKKAKEKTLGIRTEVKNINSFKFVENAINYEIKRQIDSLESGKKIIQETRLYDPVKNETRSMRSKEEANDYRYFPDPDLLPVIIDEKLIQSIKASIPELPDAKKKRFMKEFKLSEYDTSILVSDKLLSEFFEYTVTLKNLDSKMVANWIITEVLALAKKSNLSVQDYPVKPEKLAFLLSNIADETISNKQAKGVFLRMWANGDNPEEIIQMEGLEQISDIEELNKIVENVLKNNYKYVGDYQNGKVKLFGFFVGEVMKETQGKANPKLVNQILKDKLKKEC